MQVNPAVTEGLFAVAAEVEVPVTNTIEPGLPPVQVTVKPWLRFMLAATFGLVQLNRGLVKVRTEVNEPTSAPPVAVNVNVPPACGIAPGASEPVNAPLMPPCFARVRATPPGPAKLMPPGSSPVMAPKSGVAVRF